MYILCLFIFRYFNKKVFEKNSMNNDDLFHDINENDKLRVDNFIEYHLKVKFHYFLFSNFGLKSTQFQV